MVFFVTPLFVDSTLGDSCIFPVCLRMPIGHPFFLFNTILILPIYKKREIFQSVYWLAPIRI